MDYKLNNFTGTFFVRILKDAKRSANLMEFATNLGVCKPDMTEIETDNRIRAFLKTIADSIRFKFDNLQELFDTVMANREIIEQADREWIARNKERHL